ncbi:diguanylate cyclase [Bacteroidales bacterium]|nr:diguanylate cyclase [Bacteroidales bacterium]
MERGLETRYAGLNLKNPLIIGSSGLTDSVHKNIALEKAGAGAIVLKSLFEEQISLQSDWMMQDSDYPEATDYIQSYVKNNAVEDYLRLIRESKQACHIPIIASIHCYKSEMWADFARQIELAGADAIELNVFRLYTEIGESAISLGNSHLSILKNIKEAVSIPVVIKMSKFFDNITDHVSKLHAGGAAGVVLFNKFYQADIDIYNLEVCAGRLFSSPSDLSDTLRWTGIVSGRVPEISLASSTGIFSWEDVVKCILAGASAVQLCSVLYQNEPSIIIEIKKNIQVWMEKMNYASIDDFRGKLNYHNTADPSLYERVQFLKYFFGYSQEDPEK